MIWWSITIDPHGGASVPGYLAISSVIAGTAIGVYDAKGVIWPDQPGYSYTTMAVNVAAPPWAAQVADFAPPDPPASSLSVNAWQFVLLFTPKELAGIRASPDALVQQFLLAVQTSQLIDLTDNVVVHGVAYLVAIGLLDSARADDLLAGKPHS